MIYESHDIGSNNAASGQSSGELVRWSFDDFQSCAQAIGNDSGGMERYQVLVYRHFNPRLHSTRFNFTESRGDFERLLSFESFRTFRMIWLNSIAFDDPDDPRVVQYENKKRVVYKKLIVDESLGPIRDLIDHDEDKKLARRYDRAITAGKNFFLIREDNSRSNLKPLIGTKRLNALMASVYGKTKVSEGVLDKISRLYVETKGQIV